MTQEAKLTVESPVDQETRARLEDLRGVRSDIADKLLSLEQEKVRLLVAANRVEEDFGKVFEKVLLDRGIAPNTPVEIDSNTGALRVMRQPSREATL